MQQDVGQSAELLTDKLKRLLGDRELQWTGFALGLALVVFGASSETSLVLLDEVVIGNWAIGVFGFGLFSLSAVTIRIRRVVEGRRSRNG